MKKTPSVRLIVLAILLHFQYFIWLSGQWQYRLNIFYPLIVILSSILFFYGKLLTQRKIDFERPYLGKAAFFLILTSLGIWAFSFFNREYIWMAGFSLPLLIHGIVRAEIGKESRYYIFPIYVLLFLVPFHEILGPTLNPILREAVISSTAFLLNQLGIDIVREGLALKTYNYSLVVANGASGLESLTVSLLFAALLANLTQRIIATKVVLFFSIIPLIFLPNIIRITGTFYLGTLFGAETATVVFYSPGCMVVAIFIFPIIIFEGLLLRLATGKK